MVGRYGREGEGFPLTGWPAVLAVPVAAFEEGMKTNQFELSKRKWLDAIKRWQAEWKEVADETGIVPLIEGTYGLMLVSAHGIDVPADLRFTHRPKRAKR